MRSPTGDSLHMPWIIKVLKLILKEHLSDNLPTDQQKNQAWQTCTCRRNKTEPKPIESQTKKLQIRRPIQQLCVVYRVKSSRNIQVTKDVAWWESIPNTCIFKTAVSFSPFHGIGLSGTQRNQDNSRTGGLLATTSRLSRIGDCLQCPMRTVADLTGGHNVQWPTTPQHNGPWEAPEF